MTLIMWVSSLAGGGGALAAAERFGLVAAGGLWAMLLALIVWPLRPYRPARLAVSACYEALADLADRIAVTVGGDPSGTRVQEEVLRQSAAVRAAVESARGVVGTTRRGRLGESRRGESILLLLETADRLFGRLVAVRDVAAAAPHGDEWSDARSAMRSSLSRSAAALRAIADTAVRERDVEEPPDVSVGVSRLREAARPSAKVSSAALAAFAHATELATQIDDLLDEARAAVGGIRQARRARPTEAPGFEPHLRKRSFAPVRDHFSTNSVIFRHAFRLGVTTAVAVLASAALEIPKAQWVTIAAVVILQPYVGATTVKGLQRVAGTVIGGALAALLAGIAHDSLGFFAVVFVLSATAVALLPLNYTAYAAFGTATFVLLAEVSSGDWNLVGVRVANTFAGAGLALAASWLLWPGWEHERFREAAATALRAAAEYVRRVASARGEHEVAAARRQVALTTINAETSLQRLLVESPPPPSGVQARMALLAYSRQLTAAVTALLYLPPDTNDDAASAIGLFADSLAPALERIADAVAAGIAPAEEPALDPLHPAHDAVGVRIDRALAQARALRDAAARLAMSRSAT
jgi:uncharacterized membrane protein YccC